MYYGQSPSEVAFGYGYADSVGEENRFVAGESISLDFATNATAQSPVGSYRIYVAQTELSNYRIRQTEGTLEVKARPIIVTFENAETAYGDLLDLSENSEFYKTVSVAPGAELGAAAAIVNGDAAPFGFVTAAEQYSSVGKYLITGAGKNENYAIVFEGTDGANSVHTVVQREIRVAIGVSDKTYDNSPIVVTADAVGLVNQDTVEFAFEYTGRGSTVYSGGAPKNAGLYTVSVSLPESGTAAQGNYALVGTEEYPTQKDFAISKKALTVTADPATVVYGDAAAAMSVS